MYSTGRLRILVGNNAIGNVIRVETTCAFATVLFLDAALEAVSGASDVSRSRDSTVSVVCDSVVVQKNMMQVASSGGGSVAMQQDTVCVPKSAGIR